MKLGVSQGTGRQDLGGYPEGQRAQEVWLVLGTTSLEQNRVSWQAGSQGCLVREMRNSWKGSSTTGTYRKQTWRQTTQKKHRNISWACRARTRHAKHPLGSKLVRSVEGSKEDTVIGTRGRLRKTGLLCPRDKGYSKTWTAQYLLCLSLHCQGFLLDLPALTGLQQSSYRK